MTKKVCEVSACAGCPLRNKYPDSEFVAPRLGSNLRLQIGDNPGQVAADLGHPIGGGGWLRAMYQKAGLVESENSALNVIQCKPPDEIFPTDKDARKFFTDKEAHDAVEHCRNAHVRPFLQARPWTRVDTFGDAPLRFLLGKTSGIHTWRGSILPVLDLQGRNLAIPTFHPRYVAKDQAMLPVAINDLRKSLQTDPECYNIFPSLDDVRKFRSTKFAFDIETNGWTKEVRIVGLCSEDFHVIVVPFIGEYINELKRIFIEADEVVGQNIIQFDLPVLKHNGIEVRSPRDCMVWDIMLMHHLRFPVFPHDLEFVGKQFTNKGAWKADKVSNEIYNARDTDVTWQSFGVLHSLLIQADLLDVYKYVSWPMGRICRMMTDTGLTRSSNRIMQLREELKLSMIAQEQLLPEHMRSYYKDVKKVQKLPPGSVNAKGQPIKQMMVPHKRLIVPWRSPEAKMKYLYEELRDAKGKKLPKQLHLKTKEVTCDKNALDRLYTRHRLPELRALKELNRCATLLNNFAKEDLKVNDVIHPSFNVHGTEAGRLSSSGPNIQNQPAAVRYSYVSRYEDGRIISVDYSGIENRVVAFLAKDRRRTKWFQDPKFSEHKYLASCIEEIPYDEVVKSKDKDSPYAMAKVIVHGSDRLMGSKKIAAQYDLDFNRTKEFQAIWKKEISDTIDWQRQIGNKSASIGWLANPFKRKIWLWMSDSVTKAVSFMPQSTAADVIYRAMIGLMYVRIDWPEEWARKVVRYIEPLPEGADLLAQVHDELVVDTEKAEDVPEVTAVLNRVMTQPWPELDGLSLPIGEASGISWGDCE